MPKYFKEELHHMKEKEAWSWEHITGGIARGRISDISAINYFKIGDGVESP